MILYARKDYSNNLIKFSKEENYLINIKNNIVYSSLEKGISIEYAIDKLFPKESGIFVFENLEQDEIAIIFINSIKKTIVFNIKIEKDFLLRKVENFIKLICFQDSICKVYFFNDSKVKNAISLPKYVQISYLDKSEFKKSLKRTNKLRNNQNKVLSLLGFLLIIFAFSYAFDRMFLYLTNKSNDSFDKNYSHLMSNKINLEDELLKYEGLSLNLKEIRIVNSYEEYKLIKEKESIIEAPISENSAKTSVQGEFQ